MIDDTYRKAERMVYLSHPYRVAARKIIVDCHHMHTLTRKSVEIRGESRYESLSFAGAHLGDIALMQDHATDELDVEMTLTELATRDFAHGRKGFRSELVETLSLFKALTKGGRTRLEFVVGKRLESLLEGIHLRYDTASALERRGIPVAEYPCYQRH